MNFLVPYRIYPCSVLFSFGQSDKELSAELKKQKVKRSGLHKYHPQDAAVTVHYENGFTLIRMRVVPSTPEDWGKLAHEISHAVFFLMEFIGATLCRESCEAYTYAVEYLMTEACKRILPGE